MSKSKKKPQAAREAAEMYAAGVMAVMARYSRKQIDRRIVDAFIDGAEWEMARRQKERPRAK